VTGAVAMQLRAGSRTLALDGRPLLMGVVNVSPDSFSDGATVGGLDAQVARARELVDAGADLIDVGGESAVTDRPALDPEQEIERVVPLVERLAGELGLAVSVDTYKPAVAEASVAAGACMVNDVSGLRDPGLADVCARTGAALVLMHTVGPPKRKVLDHPYQDVADEVAAFLAQRIELARERGVAFEQLVLDPGPDFGKTPAQTVAALRGMERLHELGRPLLLAVSRKDFVGALTGRAPHERLAGTLAAVGCGIDAGARILRVHDVAAVADYLAVRDALRGERDVPAELALEPHLRHQGD
jgi:dihydropteroate synthase